MLKNIKEKNPYVFWARAVEREPGREAEGQDPAQEGEKEEHACLFWPNAFM